MHFYSRHREKVIARPVRPKPNGKRPSPLAVASEKRKRERTRMREKEGTKAKKKKNGEREKENSACFPPALRTLNLPRPRNVTSPEPFFAGPLDPRR